MKQAAKTYYKNFFLSMALYMVSILATVYYLRHNEVAMWLQVILVLLPVIPQRQQAMEAVLIAFLVVAFGTFAYGFLEGIGFPKLDTIFILPIMTFAWGFGRALTARKYK